jgi:hypothetical protein
MLLATAMQSYTMFLDRNENQCSDALAERRMQHKVRGIAAHGYITECDVDLLTWVCLMIRATTVAGSDAWRWANSWGCSFGVSEGEQNRLGRKFVPIAQQLTL